MESTNPYIAPQAERSAFTTDHHRNLGRALFLATVGTVAFTSLSCFAAESLALNRFSTANLGEDLFFGVAYGAIGAVPLAIVTCCLKDAYRIPVAFVGGLSWAWLIGAGYNYWVYAISNC